MIRSLAAVVISSLRSRSLSNLPTLLSWISTIRARCSRDRELNTMISSTRLRNSGRKCWRRDSSRRLRVSSVRVSLPWTENPMVLRSTIAVPTLDVMTITVFLKFTVRPCPSVRRPYSVLLFDEIEKAHPDVFHILLQILDDGRLPDGQGRTVNFKNTVIVMTSNVVSAMVERNTIGYWIHGKDTRTEETRKRLLEALKQQFRPEFLNRVDDIIVFNSLTREHLARIADIQLDNVGKLLKDRKLQLEITAAAKDRIITEGWDPQYGARPMKRAIQRLIQDPLALKLITGGFAEGDTILVDATAEPDHELSFTKLVTAPVAAETAEARI